MDKIGVCEIQFLKAKRAMYSKIKIFGERNTSTNALKNVIASNTSLAISPSTAKELDSLYKYKNTVARKLFNKPHLYEKWIDSYFKDCSAQNAWKHCATNFDSVHSLHDHLVIFYVRHPASWLLALHRKPYHSLQSLPKKLEDFVNFPWRTSMRDRLQGVEITPIELYNMKLKSYLQFGKILQQSDIDREMLAIQLSRRASVYWRKNMAMICLSFGR